MPSVRAVAHGGGPRPDGEVDEVMLQASICSGREVALLVNWCRRDCIRESKDVIIIDTNFNETQLCINKAS